MTSRAILTDIEGTTSSLSMVRQVLFPYARRALPEFVRARGAEPHVRHWLDEAARAAGGVTDDEQLVVVLRGWMDADHKQTALKGLQGLIWQEGYEQGRFAAHVYPDAIDRLRGWHRQGERLYVYSSGSVSAQRAFFSHSVAGDLTSLFSGYFDTEVGAKTLAASYERVAELIGRPTSEILYLSDAVSELDAAREAGLRTTLLDRRSDYPQARTGIDVHGHRRAESFEEID
jgi:enolase-phosphatase E1